MQSIVKFRVELVFGSPSIMPVVDGTSLADCVSAYEIRKGYAPTGNYAGFFANGFGYGPLEPYLLGQAAGDYWREIGGIYLLACRHCGEVGCWPLIAKVTSESDFVTWNAFRQPHRPQRDYTGFGPFVFERRSYTDEIRELIAALDHNARHLRTVDSAANPGDG
jgi:hypothetical protein